ncbi:CpsD/CapB family tyrosine-protein kinase [Bacillus sp. B190/17]|uniref:CpsD/CapB family tyrosine-protein kinase n=1 Tax=Bacillus lumedeiriae TaxID=3058829 RepID=A0ABW8IB31_9BACI
MLRKRQTKRIEQLQFPEKWKNTEQMRIVRSHIQQAFHYEKPVLMITSPEENELQPLVSSKLASSFAETGKKVLLVDGNFRKPALHKLFEIHNMTGLGNVLMGEEGAASEVFIQHLYVLPAGPFPIYPKYLERFKSFIHVWQNDYDVVILEAPACLEVADAQILSTACNGVILVIQANQTKKEDALKAKKMLERAGSCILGAIYQTS